jgi:serine protease Do
MSRGFFVSRMSVAFAIIAACAIALAMAAGTMRADGPSAQTLRVSFSAAGSNKSREARPHEVEDGSVADAVKAAKPAVFSVRVTYRAAAGEPDAGAPLDHFENLLGKSFPETRPRVRTSKGSGFFISADGYAVTNRHVTAESEKVELITDDRKSYRANVVAVDPATDIALLKVDGGNGFAHVEFADKAPRIGDRIFAVGNPFGLGGTVTSGIVSARERSIASEDDGSDPNVYEDLIQIDAAINPGNSGGPTFDVEGHVIGINTVILSPTGASIGIGFAIPAETAKAVIAQLLETGSVTRGWLGVQFQSLTPALAGALGLKETRGALVAEPFADGPAKKAGIAPGDVIASVNGEIVKDHHDLSRRMVGLAPGTEISLGIVHDGEEKIVAVTLGDSPTAKTLAPPHPREVQAGPRPHSSDPESDLGLKFAPAAQTPGSESQGVVVIGIDPEGRAADLGIEAGDLIVEVSGKAVHTPDDISNALNAAHGRGRQAALMRLKSGDTLRFIAIPVDPV